MHHSDVQLISRLAQEQQVLLSAAYEKVLKSAAAEMGELSSPTALLAGRLQTAMFNAIFIPLPGKAFSIPPNSS